MKGQGRRVAVLGDMLELGDGASQLHQDIGAKAGEVADLLIGIGDYAADICTGAAARLQSEQMVQLADVEAAVSYLQEQQRPGDKILVKGSRGIRLDRLAAALRGTNGELTNGQQGS
jgi:UDP-N-acetylmuramoyl-tripeptide--D-alanyl-D-alanine ligase